MLVYQVCAFAIVAIQHTQIDGIRMQHQVLDLTALQTNAIGEVVGQALIEAYEVVREVTERRRAREDGDPWVTCERVETSGEPR